MALTIGEDKVVEILEKFNFNYYRTGPNVGANFFGATCPFCDDETDHLGIHKTQGRFTCWKCKARGSFFELLNYLFGVGKREYDNLIEKGVVDERTIIDRMEEVIAGVSEDEEEYKLVEVPMPKFCYPVLEDCENQLVNNYLSDRGFTRKDCARHLCYYGRVGEYMNRLVIPVIHDDKVVAVVGADMTRKAQWKYKISAGTKVNNYLYDYDMLRGSRIIITEGIFDCWRVGSDAVCCFGTMLTKRQVRLILEYKPRELIFAWDSDAYWNARENSLHFESLVEKVGVVRFPSGYDPDSYGKELGEDRLMELIEREVK